LRICAIKIFEVYFCFYILLSDVDDVDVHRYLNYFLQ